MFIPAEAYFPRSIAGHDTCVLIQPLDLSSEEDEDLSLLVATDWVVRAAAGLCIAAKHMGVLCRLQVLFCTLRTIIHHICLNPPLFPVTTSANILHS